MVVACSRPDLYAFPDGSVWLHNRPRGGDRVTGEWAARVWGALGVFGC